VGSDSYGEVEVESLDVLGTLKLNGTTVSKQLKITGNLVANSAHLPQVDAEGNVQCTDTVLQQQTSITGSLQAHRSEFCQPLFFTGQKALFSSCKLSGITVQRDNAFKGKQVVELKAGSCVDGPIVFQGGGGEVHLYPGSKVSGTVTGGKIIHKN